MSKMRGGFCPECGVEDGLYYRPNYPQDGTRVQAFIGSDGRPEYLLWHDEERYPHGLGEQKPFFRCDNCGAEFDEPKFEEEKMDFINIEQKVLHRAHNLIEQGGWHQGGLAADENGKAVKYDSSEAVKFCIYGAILRAESEFDLTCLTKARGIVLGIISKRVGPGHSLADYNDDILKTAEQAIQLLEEAEKRAIELE